MNYATAQHIDIDDIPVIDIGCLVTSQPSSDDKSIMNVANAMREAAERVGFFYVRNHGIDDQLIAQTDRIAREFFALPIAAKRQLAPSGLHRGFIEVGQAKMHDNARPDLKESFIWGLDVASDDPDYLAGNRMIGPNQWPATLPEMRPIFNDYFEAANHCAKGLLRAFAVALDIEPDHFSRHFDKPVSRGSVVYYPAQSPDVGETQFGVSPHTDYGVITLLHQDQVGGLQVSNRRGEWLTAHPIPGTLVINVGDLLARWTNNRFKSTPHRVVNASGRERLAIAVFADPNYDTPIIPVVTDGATAHFEQTECGPYILGRYDSSFAYRKDGQS